MQTKHEVRTKKTAESEQKVTQLTVDWPEGTPEWLAELAADALIVKWQSQIRTALKRKEKPLREIPQAAAVKAEDFKPRTQASPMEKARKEIAKLKEKGLSDEDIRELLEG